MTVNSLLIISIIAAAVGSSRPNIVLIVADDLGYGELGCYGGKEIATPNIDRLAATGARFTNGYVTAPFCAASRAALLTSRYQTRFGFEFNPIGAKNADPAIGLPTDQVTIADRLREAGYATALVGKWHLGGAAPYHPQRRGFDQFFGFLHEGHYYVPPPFVDVTTWLRRHSLPDGAAGRWTSSDGRTIWTTHLGNREPDYDADNPILRSSQPVTESTFLTDAFTREACDFIRRKQEQPFFLCLTYNAVHSPMQATDATLARFTHIPDVHRRLFAAMLAHLDDGVGQVLQTLHDVGVDSRTLVMFLSDNGGPTKELTSSNAPLRGGKGELWEGGIRVPMLLRYPEFVPAGQVSHAPMISMDLSRTALSVGQVVNGLDHLDGINLLPQLRAPAPPAPTRTLYWRVGEKHALRSGDWKLIREGRRQPQRQLYHLGDDQSESRNRAAESPAVVADLTQQWETWNQQQIEPRWR